jgi:hypothetical protein
VRAQVFGWVFLAASFYVLRWERGNARLWILPLTALWANVHASAMLMPGLLAIWSVGLAWEQRRWSAQVRQAVLLTIGTAVAVCLTPLGPRLPLYAAQVFTSPIRGWIVEWHSMGIYNISVVCGVLPLVVAGCFAGMGRRRREALIFLVCFYLALSAVRNISVCAIVIAPYIAARLSLLIPERVRVNQLLRERGVTVVAYAMLIPCALLVTWNLAHAQRLTTSRLPVGGMRAAAAHPGSHRIYCEDFAWCSLALDKPNMREFIDGRCDPFPLALWYQYEDVAHVRPHWQAILDRNNIDEVLAARTRPLAHALSSAPGWRLLYADHIYKVFVRDGTPRTAYQ